MTDFAKQTPKTGFQTANAKFLGYSEEPKVGTKDGKVWRKAKMSFQQDGRQNPNKYVMWSPIANEKSEFKSDTELTQFKTYNIVWVEEAMAYQGKEWVEKRIVIVNQPSVTQQQATMPQQQGSTGSSLPNDDEFQQGIVDYLNQLRAISKSSPGEEQNLKIPTRMLGAILNSTRPQEYKRLLDACKEALNNFKP